MPTINEPTLFGDLLPEEKRDIKVFQSNAITEARYDMTLMEKNMFYILLHKIKEKNREEKTLNYQISFSEIKELIFEGKRITDYGIIRKATKKLMSRVFEVWKKDTKGNDVLEQHVLIPTCKYKSAESLVEIKVNEEMKEELLSFAKGYTGYSMRQAISLKSTYSRRIFENINRWKDIGFWKIKEKDFRAMMRLENKYEGYGMLKKRVIASAIKEINDSTDLIIKVNEEKKGRKVEWLIFEIRFKEKTMPINFPQVSPMIRRMVNDFKLSEKQANQIVESISEREINQMLYAIKLQLKDIKNLGGYTWSTFKNRMNLS